MVNILSIVSSISDTRCCYPNKIALPKDIELTTDIIYTGYFTKLALAAVAMFFITLMLSKVIQKLVAKAEAIEESESVLEPVPARYSIQFDLTSGIDAHCQRELSLFLPLPEMNTCPCVHSLDSLP